MVGVANMTRSSESTAQPGQADDQQTVFPMSYSGEKQLHKCKNKNKIKFRVSVSSFHTYLLSGIEPLAGRRPVLVPGASLAV